MHHISHAIVTIRKWLRLAGGALVIVGLLTLLWPGTSLLVLVRLVASLITIWGLGYLLASWRTPHHHLRSSTLVAGSLATLLGLCALTYPSAVVGVITSVIGVLALLWGLICIGSSSLFTPGSRGRLLWLSSGLGSIVVALALLCFPFGSARAILWVIGGYALLAGLILLITLRQLRPTTTNRTEPATRSPRDNANHAATVIDIEP